MGVLMPATAALLLTARTAGRAGVRELMVRLTSWRVNWKWWAALGFSTKHGSAFSRDPLLTVL